MGALARGKAVQRSFIAHWLGASPHAQHAKPCFVRDESHVFQQSLRYEHAIERVFVRTLKTPGQPAMSDSYRQREKSVLRDASLKFHGQGGRLGKFADPELC